MHCVRSRFSRWLSPQALRKQSTWHFLWRMYKNTTVFTTNFQRNIETHGVQENQLLESNRREIRFKSLKGVLCLSRRLLRRKTPIITRKNASSRSRRFAAAMLNLRNGANYVVRPRFPRSSFSDRSDRNDHMETINRCDRWTIFDSNRSDHMESRLYPFSPARINTPRSVFALFYSFYIKLILCPH